MLISADCWCVTNTHLFTHTHTHTHAVNSVDTDRLHQSDGRCRLNCCNNCSSRDVRGVQGQLLPEADPSRRHTRGDYTGSTSQCQAASKTPSHTTAAALATAGATLRSRSKAKPAQENSQAPQCNIHRQTHIPLSKEIAWHIKVCSRTQPPPTGQLLP